MRDGSDGAQMVIPGHSLSNGTLDIDLGPSSHHTRPFESRRGKVAMIDRANGLRASGGGGIIGRWTMAVLITHRYAFHQSFVHCEGGVICEVCLIDGICRSRFWLTVLTCSSQDSICGRGLSRLVEQYMSPSGPGNESITRALHTSLTLAGHSLSRPPALDARAAFGTWSIEELC